MLALLGQQRALGTYYRDGRKGEVIPQKKGSLRGKRKALNACVLIPGSPGAELSLHTVHSRAAQKSFIRNRVDLKKKK